VQSGQVVSVFNDHVPAASAPPAAPLRPEPLGSQLPPHFTFMMERPEDKVAAIDARICEGRRRLAEALGADAFGAAAAVGQPVQEDAWFVGRVVADSDGGALNAASLMLEGDVAGSGGARAALDLSLVPAARLFPGQIVGVRGFNPTGGRIVARQVVTHVPPPAGAGAAGAGAMDVDGPSPAAAVAVAAGPFTTADDPAGFAPLDALLAALGARPAPPAMLVLLGPFVDVEQPAVAAGSLDVTFQALFVHQVRTPPARPATCRARLCPRPPPRPPAAPPVLLERPALPGGPRCWARPRSWSGPRCWARLPAP
jgi:DNA polymerase alpha subunit B